MSNYCMLWVQEHCTVMNLVAKSGAFQGHYVIHKRRNTCSSPVYVLFRIFKHSLLFQGFQRCNRVTTLFSLSARYWLFFFESRLKILWTLNCILHGIEIIWIFKLFKRRLLHWHTHWVIWIKSVTPSFASIASFWLEIIWLRK